MSLPYIATTSPKNENVTAYVSSSCFSIVPSLFTKVEKLNWQQKKGALYLNANADVFEILLQFLMFQKLPKTTNVTYRQASELTKLCKDLDDTKVLIEHVKIVLEAKQNEASSSMFQRLCSRKLTIPPPHKGNPTDSEAQQPGGGEGIRSASSSSSSTSSSHHRGGESTFDYKAIERPVTAVEVSSKLPDITVNRQSVVDPTLELKDSGLTEDEDEVHDRKKGRSVSIVALNPFDVFLPSTTRNSPTKPLAPKSSAATSKSSSSIHSNIVVDADAAAAAAAVESDENTDPASVAKSIRVTSKAILKRAVQKIKDQHISRTHKALVTTSEYVM